MSYLDSRAYALAILAVNEGYTLAELKTSYLKKAKIFHPDMGGTHEEFLKLQDAYEYLKAEPTPELKFVDVNDGANPNVTTRRFYSKTINTNFSSFFREAGSNILEIFVVFFSNSSYLFKATFMQSIAFGLWFNAMLKNSPSPITPSWILELVLLVSYLITVIILLSSLIALFHSYRLFTFLRFDRFAPKKLNIFRNLSVLFFAIGTFPGYVAYLSILIAFKLIGLISKVFK